jgi:hypothetical protein
MPLKGGLSMKRLLLILALLTAFAPAVAQAEPDSWQVAGVVSLGEPQLRIVYDANTPGARLTALRMVRQMQADLWYYGQPGSTFGKLEAAYSDHLSGIQLQVYTNDRYSALASHDVFEAYGINMTGCWETPGVCPGWSLPLT